MNEFNNSMNAVTFEDKTSSFSVSQELLEEYAYASSEEATLTTSNDPLRGILKLPVSYFHGNFFESK